MTELTPTGRITRVLFAAALLAVVVALLLRTRRGLEATTLSLDAGELAARPSSPPPSDLPAPSPSAAPPRSSAWTVPHSPEELARARAERDEMRQRIYRAFGEPPPEEPPPSDSPARHAPYAPMPELDGGQIDPAYIQSVVRDDYFPLARSCYAELVNRFPDAGGRITFDFTIVGNENVGGIVERADVTNDSTLNDPAMVTCMRESMLSMTFAPPPNGGAVTVTYPIIFSNEDDDAAP